MNTLPIQTLPEYTTTLPLSKKKIKYRPFTVGEENIMITAIESKNPDELADAIFQILRNCTMDKVKIEELPVTDVTWLLILLRSQSKDEICEISFVCHNLVDELNEDGEATGQQVQCEHKTTLKFNLKTDVVVDTSQMKPDKIKLYGEIGLKLKPPKMGILKSILTGEAAKLDNQLLKETIDYVWQGEDITYIKDVSNENLDEFFKSLTRNQKEQIKDYVDSLPEPVLNVSFKCAACGHKEEMVVRNIHDFLA